MTGDFCILKFLRYSMKGKYLMYFESQTSIFKFLQCNMNGAKAWCGQQTYWV